MSDNIHILSLIAFSPLLGVLVLLFMPKNQGQWIKTVAIVTTLIPLVLSAWLYSAFNHQLEGMQFKEEFGWIQVPLNHEAQGLNQMTSFFFQFKYTMAVDGLSLPLVFLTALIGTMAALASVYIKKRWKSYFIFYLLLETGMFGVFMAQDLFLFFVFFEVTLIPMFFLIGIWGYMERERAANKFLIYNGLGSAIMLIAFIILVCTAGFGQVSNEAGNSIFFSGDISVITNHLFNGEASYVNQSDYPFYLSDTMKWVLFIMLVVAFGIKLPIFPFHTWMLRVHTEAPPSIVMIHSGILLKMGAYGLIRYGILLFPQQATQWATVLAILGVINILYGAILAFVQKDFKLVLAYSSISHMGIVLLGIAAFNTIGMEGAIFQLVSHGLISALLFLMVGAIYERTQTTMLDQLGGLAKNVPFISGILLVAGMASLGLPGLSGFISEFLAFAGLFQTAKVITVIGTIGVILTAVYVLRGVLAITYGPPRVQGDGMRDARLMEAIPMVALVAFVVVLGIYPAVLSGPLHQTVSSFDQFIQTVVKIGVRPVEQLRLQWSDLGYLAPELTLVIAAVVLSLLDLLMPKQTNRTALGWLSIVSIIISGLFVVSYLNPTEPKQLLNYSYRIDDFANIIKLILLTGAGLVTFMSIGSIKEEEVPHIGEYYYLLLPATLGGMIMASSGDLITLFVGLELLSITSYILVAMRKKDLRSNEAAFKYIVLGAISSAIILYGMSFLYGMSGSTSIPEINAALGQNAESMLPFLYVSFFMLLAGFGFKIAAAPFHMWAPDVYQGAQTPITAFLAVVSKAAAFAILFRVLYGVYAIGGLMELPFHGDVLLSLMVVAAAAMILGNFTALRQNNLKRLLAYSGIANSGYLLIPIATHFSMIHYSNFSEFAFYLIAYLFMNIGIFAVLMIIERSTGDETMSGLAGLYYRDPGTAVATVFLVLSLAGLPLSGGFFGKVFIMMGAMQTQHYWLAAVMIITSVVSFYYYFGLIRQMFMRTDFESREVTVPLPLGITLWLCAGVSLLLGIVPQWVLSWIDRIFSLTQDLFFFS